MKDCIVVGGGPAGLTAALYLARFLRSVTVFDAQEGRARMIPKTHNLGPFPDGISGRDLLDRMRSHAERYGAAIETGTVNAVEKQGDVFHITTDRRVEIARNVILASGVFNHRPPLSIEDHDRGLARGLIRYCPVCDAYEVRDKRIAVLGNDAHGFDEACFIRDYSSTVTLIPPDGSLSVARDGICALESPMKGLALSDTQVIVALENGEVRHFDTVYVALGTTAQTGLAASLGVRLAEGGCVVVDAKQRTSIDRVYAIGDVTDGLDQIAVAMAQGAVAATAIHNDLPATMLGFR
jgi:thioredoxin reductase (NADPH)